MTGHAIEARVYAEDPGRDFLPTGGTVLDVAEPTVPASGRFGHLRGAPSSAATTTRCSPRSSRTPTTGPRRCRRWTARWPTPPSLASPRTSTSFASCSPTPMSSQVPLDTGLLDRRAGDFRRRRAGRRRVRRRRGVPWLRYLARRQAMTCGRCRRDGGWAKPRADHTPAAFGGAHRPRTDRRNPAGSDGERGTRRNTYPGSHSRRQSS